MIVYNLACENDHLFEGWFASPADFENQRDRGLVECPACTSKAVERKLHAPRVNVGAGEVPAQERLAVLAEGATQGKIGLNQLHAGMQALREEIRANTENVGARFADEARAMHYGEKAQRNIRGQTSKDEAEALREEGIEFGTLPFSIDQADLH